MTESGGLKEKMEEFERRIIQNAPTRIAAVQWMNAGRLAGSSVRRRNSVACSSVGLPKTTGMLK